MLQVQFVGEGDFIEPVNLANVAFQDLVGRLILLEGLEVSRSDDLPSEIHVLQPIVIVQPLPLPLKVPLQVPLRKSLPDQRPKLLIAHESVRA
jgi:hypothetical protein